MSREVQMVKFKGLCKYAKLYPGQEQSPHPEAVKEAAKKGYDNSGDRHYSVSVECSEELFKKLKKAGIPPATTLKEYEPGDKGYVNGDENRGYITLRASKVRGEWVFEDPEVTKDGEAFDQAIGNGSVVEAEAELAPIKGRSGKALRLKKVTVLEHVPYEVQEKEVTYLNDEPAKKPAPTGIF